jgi:hypothetical protein
MRAKLDIYVFFIFCCSLTVFCNMQGCDNQPFETNSYFQDKAIPTGVYRPEYVPYQYDLNK